jgi:hypothetical protein
MQEPELHQEVSVKQDPVLVFTFLSHRGLNYARCVWRTVACTGLDNQHVYTRGALASPGRVYTPEALAAPGRVYTTGA